VHPKVDDEFQRSAASALAALEAPALANAKSDFRLAYEALASETPNKKACLGHIFSALESVFRTRFESDLDAANASKAIGAYVDRKCATADPATKSSSRRFVDSFAKLVDALHPYRHGHVGAVAVDPPIELVIAQFSASAAYLRWLATM
jgi:hypothetical protein